MNEKNDRVFDEINASPEKGYRMTTESTPPSCPECNDTGERDSGGTYPWGEPIYLACHCDGESFIDEMLIKHNLIDVNGQPTALLTGESE